MFTQLCRFLCNRLLLKLLCPSQDIVSQPFFLREAMATVRWQPIIEDEEGNSWTPSLAKLDRIGDELFVTLSCSDAGFKAFCGKVGGEYALSTSWFLQELRDRRNSAVRLAIEKVLRERATDGRTGDYAREGKQIEEDALPRVVEVQLPPVSTHHGEGADGLTTRVILRRNSLKAVSVQVTEENMEYIRVAVRQTADKAADRSDDDDDAADHPESVETGVKGVTYNKKRKGLIYRYKDEDGRRVSKSMKIKDGDDVKEMAKRLVDSCKDS